MMMLIFQIISTILLGILAWRARFNHFNQYLCILAVILVTLSAFVEISLYYFFDHIGWNNAKETNESLNQDLPVVLWWTPFTHSSGHVRKCYGHKCIFTGNRDFKNTSSFKAYAFYGTNLNITDLPTSRNGELWSLFHEESPKNAPHLLSNELLSLFNYTATFSRRSHLPLTTLHLESLAVLKDLRYFVSTNEKNKLRKELAPVLYVQSNCDTLTNRDAYVEELSNYINIDSYGTCVHNTNLPKNLSGAESASEEEFLHFVSRYKFTLAIENAVCEDYITEKLWRSLLVGSVPLYFGSPSIRDWLPNYDSAIVISDFEDAKQIATYVKELDNDDTRYNHYLRHKLEGIVSNKFLKNVMKYRRWYNFDSLIEEFECQLCLRLHNLQKDDQKVDETHYNCTTATVSSVKGNEEWGEIMRTGRCEGLAAYEFIVRNISYTAEDVRRRWHQLINEGAC